MKAHSELAIIGSGNIGRAIAEGLAASDRFAPEDIVLTCRKAERLDEFAGRGFQVQSDNRDAVRRSDIVIVAVQPQQLDGVLQEIAGDLDPARHLLISVVSGATIEAILNQVGSTAASMTIVRAMPNTGIALRQSMTCVSLNTDREDVRQKVVSIFDAVGKTMVIDEEQMVAATALCACGIAFFLRSVRAASQGGIEIGFHPEEALTMAAQTALGAATLVLGRSNHPEREIDSVTTPRGCTISGLNEMEHHGFSSALIRGITTSFKKANSLYSGSNN
jgi:pyrroline-5-carboxylate reductase